MLFVRQPTRVGRNSKLARQLLHTLILLLALRSSRTAPSLHSITESGHDASSSSGATEASGSFANAKLPTDNISVDATTTVSSAGSTIATGDRSTPNVAVPEYANSPPALWELELAPFLRRLYPPHDVNGTAIRGPPRLTGIYQGSWLKSSYGDALRRSDFLTADAGRIILHLPEEDNPEPSPAAAAGAHAAGAAGNGRAEAGQQQLPRGMTHAGSTSSSSRADGWTSEVLPGGIQDIEGELLLRDGSGLRERGLRFRLRGVYVAAAAAVHAVLEPQLPQGADVEPGDVQAALGLGPGLGLGLRPPPGSRVVPAGSSLEVLGRRGGSGGGSGGSGGDGSWSSVGGGGGSGGGGEGSGSSYRSALRAAAAHHLAFNNPRLFAALLRATRDDKREGGGSSSSSSSSAQARSSQQRALGEAAVAAAVAPSPPPPWPPWPPRSDLPLRKTCEFRAHFRVYYKGDPEAAAHGQQLRLYRPPPPPPQHLHPHPPPRNQQQHQHQDQLREQQEQEQASSTRGASSAATAAAASTAKAAAAAGTAVSQVATGSTGRKGDAGSTAAAVMPGSAVAAATHVAAAAVAAAATSSPAPDPLTNQTTSRSSIAPPRHPRHGRHHYHHRHSERPRRGLAADTEMYHATQMQMHGEVSSGGGGGDSGSERNGSMSRASSSASATTVADDNEAGGGGDVLPVAEPGDAGRMNEWDDDGGVADGGADGGGGAVYGIPVGMDPSDPDLVFVGVIESPNCGLVLHWNASSLHPERRYRQLLRYSGVVAAVTIAQLVLVALQMEPAASPSAAARMSLYGNTLQSILDAYQCLLNLMTGLLPDTPSVALFAAAFLQFLLFAVFEMRLTLLVWRAQRTNGSGAGDGAGFWSVRRDMSAVYSRFYGLLVLGLLLGFQLQSHPGPLLLALHSWWLPQLLHSARSDTRPPLLHSYVWGMSGLRLVVPLYFLGCPHSLMGSGSRPGLCAALAVWVALQAALLAWQMRSGPRVFIPRAFLPRRYDYYRPASRREMGCDDVATPPSPATATAPGAAAAAAMSGSFLGTFALSPLGGRAALRRLAAWLPSRDWFRSSAAAAAAGPVAAVGQRRASGGGDVETGHGSKECVICMNPVPLLPVTARMVTPCGHFFHEPCLTRWMAIKMDCPTCRRPLPSP